MSESGSIIIDVGDADFEAQVIERSRQVPVVVDFWAEWCGPCRTLGPVLERLVSDRRGAVVLAKVNVEEATQLATLLRIQSIPLVVAFRDGRPVDQFAGARPEAEVEAFLDRLAPAGTPPTGQEEPTHEEADPETAEAGYRKRLEEDADDGAARLGLARILVDRGDDDEARELLDGAVVEDQDHEDLESLRSVLVLKAKRADLSEAALDRARSGAAASSPRERYESGVLLASDGRYPEALRELILAGEEDRELARSSVREVMAAIFRIVGAGSDLANEYRSRLTRLLY